ncbi:MAG: transposase [bacterium]
MAGEREHRKTYAREFKLNAVRLTTAGDVSIARVARELGVNENTLHKWRQQFWGDPKQAFPGKGKLKPDDEEKRQLRRENLRLKQEDELPKRAAVWLAGSARKFGVIASQAGKLPVRPMCRVAGVFRSGHNPESSLCGCTYCTTWGSCGHFANFLPYRVLVFLVVICAPSIRRFPPKAAATLSSISAVGEHPGIPA